MIFNLILTLIDWLVRKPAPVEPTPHVCSLGEPDCTAEHLCDGCLQGDRW